MRIWARVGMSIEVTPEEFEMIAHMDSDDSCVVSETATQLLKKLYAEGKFTVDGDCYFPCNCLGKNNSEIEFCLNPCDPTET